MVLDAGLHDFGAQVARVHVGLQTPLRGRGDREARSGSFELLDASLDLGTTPGSVLEEVPDLDAIVAPVGGGGLMSGICIAAGGLRPDIRLVGADAVFLGSDYPFPLGETAPGSLIESMEDLDDATRDRLLCGTALEYFVRQESPDRTALGDFPGDLDRLMRRIVSVGGGAS